MDGINISLTLRERWNAMPSSRKWVLGGGAAALVLFALFRKEATSALSATELAVLRRIVPKGREKYVDAAFKEGAAAGVSPWLLLGILRIEGNFGSSLQEGTLGGRTVYTGDFIPRPQAQMSAEYMQKYPLPGVRLVQWSRPQVGNLKAYSGLMWVPAYEARMAQAGGNQAAAEAYNGNVPGGVGWGFTPWQLDWGSFAPQLLAGAAYDEGAATRAAIQYIKGNIKVLRDYGLSGDSLVNAVIAAYNVSARGIVNGLKAGKTLAQMTALPSYIDTVRSVAAAAGKSLTV